MKYLIYELFSGVGFCNQLFSLETAIYLANISNRKLILLIRYPLCHCGVSSWDYGSFLDFFSNKYLQYLPQGIEVYKNKIPLKILNVINDSNTVKNLFGERLSQLVLIDKEIFSKYDCNISHPDITSFLRNRKPVIIDINSWNANYIYIKESNASRCFYNFLTNNKNYTLMSDICYSLTFLRSEFQDIFKSLSLEKNYLSFHFRLGDKRHTTSHINNASNNKINNIIEIIKENDIENIYIMCDRKDGNIIHDLNIWCGNNNKKLFYTDNITSIISQNILKQYFPYIKNFSVIKFLIEKNICQNANVFCGWHFSTVSNYIHYNNFINNKKHNLYVEGNIINDKLNYSWVSSNIWGPSIAFKCFFSDNIKINMKDENTKLITLTNDGYLEMTKNLMISMEKIGIEQMLKIYCIGNKSYNYFKDNYPLNDIELVDFAEEKLSNWIEYRALQNPDIEGKKLWANITSYKLYVINKELKCGHNIIFTDGDIVFEKNPIPYMLSKINDGLELLIQNDEQDAEHANMCTGWFWMKSNENTIKITNFDTIRENIDSFQNDQQYIRRFAKQLNHSYLELSLFPNGKYFRDNSKTIDPYIIHFNYDTGNMKVTRMKMFKKWYINNNVISQQNERINISYLDKHPITKYLLTKNVSLKQGSICELEKKVNDIKDIIKNNDIVNVLEIGFLAGHSCDMFLSCNTNIKVTSIDHLHLQSVRPGLEYINLMYKNRHKFIKGESQDILNGNELNEQFDCILIDASYKYEHVKQDIILCRKYANKDTLLMINSVVENKDIKKYWNQGPTQIWNELLLSKYIIKINQTDYETGNGIAYAKYNF